LTFLIIKAKQEGEGHMERPEILEEERRRYPRYEAVREITYSYGFYNEPIQAKTLELSLGGGRIETSLPLLVGENLEVNISVGEEEIDVLGKVIHTHQVSDSNFVVGLSFENISETKKKVLNHFFREYVENYESVAL
jgi:c-di-GMP-binding flagellar brake protein YcgR